MMNGDDLVEWYKVHKPLKDLTRIRLKNPDLYEELMASKEKKRAFEKQSIFEFRPEDYPHDDLWDSCTTNSLLTYALFYNKDTDEYLVTMRDARPDFGIPSQERENDHVVWRTTMDSKYKEQLDSIIPEGIRWMWVEHLLQRLRYSPVTSATHIGALEEADRLRSIFGSAAARGDGSSAKPLRKLFEFFPAFRRAYEGKDGFYRALNDVFGEVGNVRQLMALGVPYGGAPYGGDEEDKRFGVHADHFVNLYTDMGEQDRQDF